MSGFKVVRQQELGFDARGNNANTDEVYIKILESFQEVLGILKGARLHTFMCVATQEAKIIRGLGSALSLSSIQVIVRYSRHTVIEALDFLCRERFLEELPERESTGEKLYRVAAYAWYGTPRFTTSDKTRGLADRRSRDPLREIDRRLFKPPGAKIALRSDPVSYTGQESAKNAPRNDGGGAKKPSVNVEGSANFAPVQKNCPSSSSSSSSSSSISLDDEMKETTTTSAQILHSVGVYAAHLPEIDPARAARWAEFVRLAPRDAWRRPAGFCYTALMNDPEAEPPMLSGLAEQLGARCSVPLRRADFSDAEWHRLIPLNRRSIIARERGVDLGAVQDDLHLGCTHVTG